MDKENIQKPKEVIEEEEEKDKLEEGNIRQEDDHTDTGPKELESTSLMKCPYCPEEFSTRQAFIAHVRTYKKPVDENICGDNRTPINNKKVKIECTDEKGLPACMLCCENFPSFCSLFGHMRCHPEEAWRRIVPPDHDHQSSLLVRNDDASEGCPSTLLSTKDDFFMDRPDSVPRRKRTVKLNVNINPKQKVAADALIELSNGGEHKRSGRLKKRKYDKESKGEDMIEISNNNDSYKDGSDNPTVEGTTQPDNKYKCKNCNKSFPTHQALGGHRRSHTMSKNNILNAVVEKKKDDGGDDGTNKQDVKLDENVKETTSGGTHQSTICNKVFPTGYMRRHRTGPPSDQAGPSSNQVTEEANFNQAGPSVKSLCGHMKCHPESERGWRGIVPPDHDHQSSLLASNNDAFKGSSSNLLSTTDEVFMDRLDSVPKRQRTERVPVTDNSMPTPHENPVVEGSSKSQDDGEDNGTNKHGIKLEENVKETTSGGTHQRPICDEVFPTDQALGGHRTGPPSDQAGPSSNQVTSLPVESEPDGSRGASEEGSGL